MKIVLAYLLVTGYALLLRNWKLKRRIVSAANQKAQAGNAAPAA
jgi:hypothetical protein